MMMTLMKMILQLLLIIKIRRIKNLLVSLNLRQLLKSPLKKVSLKLLLLQPQ
jgi:hypothetical protein